MVDRFYGYQYDTNPRKLSQQPAPYRNRYSQNNNMSNNINKDINQIKEHKSKSTINRKKTKLDTQKYDTSFEKKNQNKEKINVRNYAKNKNIIKSKIKLVMFLITGFSILFAISYQNSLISESFNKKEQYKKEMEALNKTNQQIEVSIENSLNLNNIEQAAKEKIGMQKLNNNQKIYVNLPKQDYVAPAAEQIVMEEERG